MKIKYDKELKKDSFEIGGRKKNKKKQENKK